MNKEQYLQQRNGLLEEAQSLINSGDFKAFNEKKAEIENLDNTFEEGATNQANLNALMNNARVTNIQNKGVQVTGTTIDTTVVNTEDGEDLYNSIEYRKAFMNHVIKGDAIPGEFKNTAGVTSTADVGAVIPTTTLEKIVEKIESVGTILSLVTRTSYKGGLSIPTSSVKPVASWVGESETSPVQKKKTGSITFAYHKLRCAVAVSLETDTVSLAVFEATLIKNVAEAMIKAIEEAIISGTGEGQPEGILLETPEEGQELEFAELNYDTLTEAEGALPLEYEENAAYAMTKKTFMRYQSIKDADGNPVARINYGISGKPERSLLGRPVILINYIDTFGPTLEAGKPFAFIFNFADYVLNTNLQIGIKKYEDNKTDDIVNKSIMLVDGKVVDKNSLVILKKK